MRDVLRERGAPGARMTSSQIWGPLEILVGLAVSVLLIAVRVAAFQSAGALWRDEVFSVDMASFPSVFDTVWRDSFPILWQLVLRCWIALGLGQSDSALRSIGLLCGILQVAAIWWSGRQFGARVPWAMLVLLGCNAQVIVFGDEVRGYGLGLLTQILMIAAAWRVVQDPNWKRLVVFQIVALLAVQSSFTNAFMLLAACVGGGFVCCRRRNYKTLLGLLLVGLISAGSLVPYAVYVFPHHDAWAFTIRQDFPWKLHLSFFWDAISAGGPAATWTYVIGAGLALTAGIVVLLRGNGSAEQQAKADLGWFLVGNLVVGSLGFWWYIRFLKVFTAVWYYLPYVALLSICIELGVDVWAQAKIERQVTRTGVALLLFATMFQSTWSNTAYRLTNIDLIAQSVEKNASADDLVIVFPWYVGMSFQRYYHGAAPWMNFPDVGSGGAPGAYNGYLEIKENYMPRADPLRRELDRMEQTLRNGHRLWLVGGLRFLPPGTPPHVLAPAPDPQLGWSYLGYEFSWAEQAAAFVQSKGNSIRQIPVQEPVGTRVNGAEHTILLVVEGTPNLRSDVSEER